MVFYFLAISRAKFRYYLMTFWQSVFPVFIGAVFGFIFSIVLFYITNIWRGKKAKEALEKSLIKEFGYNISFLSQLID